MADTITSLGGGVSRVVPADDYQWTEVVWQQRKPPLDSELHLCERVASSDAREMARVETPSGFVLGNPNPEVDFGFDPTWSNLFTLGQATSTLTAIVDGRRVPLAASNSISSTDLRSWVRLPPPGNSPRIDFVFLEVFRALISPNPSTTNKPAVDKVYRWGNTLYGGTQLDDLIVDPAIGLSTTRRVQLQHRLRVVSLAGSTLARNPDGFLDSAVLAQGTTTAPIAGMPYCLSSDDPGLWLAGFSGGTPVSRMLPRGTAALPTNGLGTTDGWSMAVPVCAVYRRARGAYDIPNDGKGNATDRNPLATSPTDATIYADACELSAGVTRLVLVLPVTHTTTAGLPPTGTVRIDDELIRYTGVGAGPSLTGCTRGYGGTVARLHLSGASVALVAGDHYSDGTTRPDGLFADQIRAEDVVDLRHAVSPTGFNHEGLLRGGLTKLLAGDLRTVAKGDTQDSSCHGTLVLSGDRFVQAGSGDLPGVTEVLGSPDGIRSVWSDASVIHRRVVTPLRPHSAQVNVLGGGAPVNIVAPAWENNGIEVYILNQQAINRFTSGDLLRVKINSCRNSIGTTDRAVRFVSPGYVERGGTPKAYPDSATWDGGLTYTDPGGRLVEENLVTLQLDGDFEVTATDTYRLTSYVKVAAANTEQLLTRVVPFDEGLANNLTYALSGGFPAAAIPAVALRDARFYPTSDMLIVLGDHLLAPGSDWPLASGAPTFDSSYRAFLSLSLVWGPGRGLTKVAEEVFDVSFSGLSSDLLLGPKGRLAPRAAGEFPDMPTDGTFAWPAESGEIPVLSGGYADPGSKTLVIRPWQETTLDPLQTVVVSQFQIVTPVPGPTEFPNKDLVDPLDLWLDTTCVRVPRDMLPLPSTRRLYMGIDVPMLPVVPRTEAVYNGGVFSCGLNCFLQGRGNPGGTDPNPDLLDTQEGGIEWTKLTTHTLVAMPVVAAYNRSVGAGVGNKEVGTRIVTVAQTPWAGAGIQFPPYYGPSRIWAVYEVSDFVANGTITDLTPGNKREVRVDYETRAANLLRDDLLEVPLWFWEDSAGDGTFVLDASALDLTKSPVPIADFTLGKYVIEATIFGFGRGFLTGNGGMDPGILAVRTNAGVTPAAPLWLNRKTNDDVLLVLPGPARADAPIQWNGEMTAVYSRRVYQGDPHLEPVDRAGTSAGPIDPTAYGTILTTIPSSAMGLLEPTCYEVLASVYFFDTAGTGRLSGMLTEEYETRDPFYERWADTWVSTTDDPPVNLCGSTSTGTYLHTKAAGSTERLPLGRLFLDMDFSGQVVSVNGQVAQIGLHLSSNGNPPTLGLGQSSRTGLLRSPLLLSPGEVLVYSRGSNSDAPTGYFRTRRGGSLMVGHGPLAGGPVTLDLGLFAPAEDDSAITTSTPYLGGVALLVRCLPEIDPSSGTVIHPGGELQMIVATMSLKKQITRNTPLFLGPTGFGEGLSAAEVYRIPGHPLLAAPTYTVDPLAIDIAPR